MKAKQIKRSVFAILIIAMFLLGVMPVVYSAEDIIPNDNSGIPDSVLYNSLVEMYDENMDGKLSIDECNKIDYVSIVGENVLSLEGLNKFCPNITSINASNCMLTNLFGIEGLDIKWLFIDNNDLTDIDPIKGMNNLITLNCAYNKISKLPDLTNCTQMKVEPNYPLYATTNFWYNKLTYEEMINKLPPQIVNDTEYNWIYFWSMYQDPEPPIEKDIVDQETGIQVSGLMHPDAVLNVKSVENTVENAVSTFDITLEKDGNIIQPDGTITISIPSEYTGCNVFWIKDDGTMVDMNAEYKDGNYVFTTDHLSIYALVKESDTTEPEPTETIQESTEKPTSETTTTSTVEPTTKVYPTASTNPTSKISTTDTATKDSANKGTAAISNNKGNSDNGTIQTGAISIAVILFVVLASLATGGFVWYRRKIK